MLRIIIYDIACPKRLRRISKICEDFGLRVQKSVFECWLENDRFQLLWLELRDEINLNEDKICAYSLDASAAKTRLSAGKQAILTEKRANLII